jgi:hypothetical protein
MPFPFPFATRQCDGTGTCKAPTVQQHPCACVDASAIPTLVVASVQIAATCALQASFIDLQMGGGFVQPDKSWDRSLFAFCSDGFAVVISGS